MPEAIDTLQDDEFLNAMNLLLRQKTKEYDFEFSASDKAELDRRAKDYRTGKLKTTTVAGIKSKALSKLKK